MSMPRVRTSRRSCSPSSRFVYANDWCIVPCMTAVGSLTLVDGLVVSDVFGEKVTPRLFVRQRSSCTERSIASRLVRACRFAAAILALTSASDAVAQVAGPRFP